MQKWMIVLVISATAAPAPADAAEETPCIFSSECDDGLFCNGQERCELDPVPGEGFCVEGVPPCDPSQLCFETGEGWECETCRFDSDCDDGVFCNGAERCHPLNESADSRGCLPPLDSTPCLDGEQECNEAMRRCVALCDVNPDVDSDGFTDPECGGTDCDDSDANAYPGNLEVCDPFGHDEDCDHSTYGVRDLDGDGNVEQRCLNTASDGTVFSGDDCDDIRPDVSPDSPEVCNHRDDDCDGSVDEGTLELLYLDADGDGHGARESELIMACPGDPGTSAVNDDCDDEDPYVLPGFPEVCNQKDDDCDGLVDESIGVLWYPDVDNDGHGDARSGSFLGCPGDRFVSAVNDDCDDGDPLNVPFSFQACHPDDPQSVLVCLPGDDSFPDMSVRPCLPGTWCVPQPNGAGVCQIGGAGTARRLR